MNHRALQILKEAYSDKAYDAFANPVDRVLFEDYYSVVAAPIDLDLIVNRVESNYYRQEAALEKDILMILENCKIYNEQEADIVRDAKVLVDTLITAIWPEKQSITRSSSSSSSSASSSQPYSNGLLLSQSSTVSGNDVKEESSSYHSSKVLENRTRSGKTLMTSSPIKGNNETIRLTSKRNHRETTYQEESSSDANELSSDDYLEDNKSESHNSDDNSSDDGLHKSNRRQSNRLRTNSSSLVLKLPSARSSLRTSSQTSSQRSSSRASSRTQSKKYNYKDFEDSDFEEVEIQSPSKKKARTTQAIKEKPSRVVAESTDYQRLPRLDPELKRKMLEILSKIEEEDYMHFFSDPVNEEEAPGYFDIISEPMDYSTIRYIQPIPLLIYTAQ